MPAERAAVAEEWRGFVAAASGGGEVWEYRIAGPCSCEVGFVVVRDGRVVAERCLSVSTWI